MVIDKNKIIMICLLAHAHRMPDYVQIGFFESDEFNMQAFDLIMDRAKKMAKSKNASKISGSLNIHVNYGLGFLASDYDKVQSFGMAHNPDFYNEYFIKNGFKTIDMVSYKKNITNMDNLLSSKIQKKLGERYRVREVDFSNLKKEASIYTEINNQAFSEHLFY